MTDINKPLPPIYPSDDGWKRVQRIEGYKQKNTVDPKFAEPPKPELFAIFASLFQQIFFYTKKKSKQIADKKEIAKHLLSLQAALQTLIKEDKSQDPAFTHTLSSLWNEIEHDREFLDQSMEHTLIDKLDLLMGEINQFPPWEDHSLGFYLQHRVGNTWLPAPFMEILLTMHLSAQSNPFQNALDSWCRQITEILDTM